MTTSDKARELLEESLQYHNCNGILVNGGTVEKAILEAIEAALKTETIQ